MKAKKTIIIIEDEEEQSRPLAEVLEDRGYTTVVTDNPKKALKLLAEITPDLFLVDIDLPGMNGLDFFKELKKIDRHKNTPFVFITGYTSMQMAEEASKLGATDYIAKPFELGDLIEKIETILNK